MLSVRCKMCNLELISSNKTQCCGCENMTTVIGDKVSAADLSKVVLVNSENSLKSSSVLSKGDLEYQENRRKRKVRKLNFETR
jgi:hypothetical protein